MSVQRVTSITLAALCALCAGLVLWNAPALAAAPPEVANESVTNVAGTSVTLEAQIDPDGSQTSYYFQYGTSAAYGTSEPAPPGVGLGAGEALQTVKLQVQGLASSTTYHYRVVAVSEPGGELHAGLDQTFTTQLVGSEFVLPDNRAWELVSPPDKHGADMLGPNTQQGGYIQAAEGGGALTYVTYGPVEANPPSNPSPETTQLLSTRRAPGSWETQDIATPRNAPNQRSLPRAGEETEYRLFSTDLSVGFISQDPDKTSLLPPSEVAETGSYLRMENGEYKALPNGSLADATPDMSHVILESGGALLPNARPDELYEWTAGQLQLASVLPGGEPVWRSHGNFGFGPQLGSGASDRVTNAVSNDGSRVVFTAIEHLYLRHLAAREAEGETIQIDAAEGEPEQPPTDQSVQYKTASTDDSKIFFSSHQKLTTNSTNSGAGYEPNQDLFEFEVTSGKGERLAGKLTDLSVPINSGEQAGFENVIGASEDGSSVYFVARGVLSAAENGQHEKAVSGQANLYLDRYEETTKTWTVVFIATLSGADGTSWDGGEHGERALMHMTSRVSPDGRYLAFMSNNPLTGYDNRDANSGASDEEVFLYDGNTGHLVCASCDPSGARPVGVYAGGGEEYPGPLFDRARNWAGVWVAANIPGWVTSNLFQAIYQPRYLSDSGRLVFDSADALVPADVNGTEDVYEYEQAGTGSCQGAASAQSASDVFSTAADGCVGLISSGTSTDESVFMDASESGGDVFFLTTSRLTERDYDTSADVYDAHECTATAPCATEPPLTPPPCMTGDSCKPAPTPQPTFYGAPSSETFSGAGNVTPTTTSPTTAGSKASAGQAQKLAKALKSCRKKPKRRRVACEALARKRHPARKSSRFGKSLSAGTGR